MSVHNNNTLVCPNPDCSGVIEPRPVLLYGYAYQVQCSYCGLRGPIKGGWEAAVVAWEQIRIDSPTAPATLGAEHKKNNDNLSSGACICADSMYSLR